MNVGFWRALKSPLGAGWWFYPHGENEKPTAKGGLGARLIGLSVGLAHAACLKCEAGANHVVNLRVGVGKAQQPLYLIEIVLVQ